MEIMRLTQDNQKDVLNKTLRVLRRGGLVIFPSDTVYGLLTDATNQTAVKNLINFKNRPTGKAISVFVEDLDMLNRVVKTKKTSSQIKNLLPGPFTVVLESKRKVSKLLESEKKTLGVRIPDYPLLLKLAARFGRPMTATSANPSGRSSNYSIQSLLSQISNKKKQLVDLIIDAGNLPRNKPSTVLDLTTQNVGVIRRGDIIPADKQVFVSKSEVRTKKIAQEVLKKLQVASPRLQKSFVFIIEGELGVGKTIFVKGLGESLGIKNIISPTFVVYYEYDIGRSKKTESRRKFVHIDLYNIQEDEEFKYLGIEKYLVSGNIICVEWGEKAEKIFDIFKQKSKVIYVTMKYKTKTEREIQINF